MNLPRNLAARAPWMLSLGLGALLLAAAAARPAPKVAIVDADRIRTDSAYISTRIKAISGPAEAIKTQMIAKQAELQKAVDAYQAQASAMSDAARQTQTEAIKKLQTEVNALSTQFDEALSKAGNQELEPIRGEVMDIVAKLAADRQIDVVMSSANVLYSAPGVDLTDEVIQRLDAAHPAK